VKGRGLTLGRGLAGPLFGKRFDFSREPIGLVGFGIEVVADPFVEFGAALVLGNP